MSTQMTDTVHFRGEPFRLVDAKGRGLFRPQQQGVRPDYAPLTTCLRGFLCTYNLADGRLFLTEVNLYLGARDQAKAERGEGPLLFGKVPRRYPERTLEWVKETRRLVESTRLSDDFKVDGLREPIRFTGRLTLGADLIREMYEHTLPHQAEYKYRTLYDVRLNAGRVVSEFDRSAEMVACRKRLADRRAAYEAWMQRIRTWIDRSWGGLPR